MDFRSLQHVPRPEIHRPRVLPARFVAPSGFGYPLDALLSPIPGRFYFTPAALMGFTLRSFLLAKGMRTVSDRMRPLAVSTCEYSRRRSGEPAWQASAPGF